MRRVMAATLHRPGRIGASFGCRPEPGRGICL